MRIVCAPDSFKESMSAVEASAAMSRGIRRVAPAAEVTLLPMADGGEGTCRTMVAALGGELRLARVQDALGRPITAEFGLVPADGLAILEVAAACGLEQLSPSERDPRRASTAGVGELLLAALDAGARHLIVGLGGSATNDAGTGMLTALGARFTDAAGSALPPGGASLAALAEVDLGGLDARLADCRIEVACDVDSPLLGSRGASAVFGPQKGAGPADVALLDHALGRWADVVEAATGVSVRDRAGAGAAGGLGAAFLAATPAALVPGVELVMRCVDFTARVRGADYVFTGEGSVDAQSRSGKVPWGVALAAAALGVPTVTFAGRVDPALADEADGPALAYVPITRGVTDLPTALAEGPANLEAAAAMVLRLLSVTTGTPPAPGTQPPASRPA